MSHPDIERLVLQYVNRDSYQPVKPRVIAKKLDLSTDQQRDVRRAIKSLVRQGKLEFGENHLVVPAKQRAKSDSSKRVTGTFRRAAAGFGFVRPASGAQNVRDNDIFVPAQKTLDAANGDTVTVRVTRGRRSATFGAAGEILEIVDRRTRQFVGTYFESNGQGFVQVDANVFIHPIAVGDPGAKSAQPDDKVVVELVRFPDAQSPGEGVITEVLGDRGEPGVDTRLIIAEYGLPGSFPEEVLQSARDQAEKFDESVDKHRTDLTQMTVITIDPKDARDFDDAISLERLENGHWRLGVHIADVAHFVPLKTALDEEARDRATSIYLPDRVIPMLPEIISNNLASLQPEKVRYTKTAFLEFTPEGIRVDTEIASAAIKSDRRFTYEEVDNFLAKPASWKKKLTPEVHQLMANMHTLAMTLRRRRMDGGSIELHMPEVKLDLDKKGRVSGAHRTENTESHQIIEEFMLAANEAVADYLHQRKLFFLRRVHPDPDPRKLKLLTDFVRHMKIDAESLESRFEIKRVLEAVSGEPTEYAVNFAVLRSMQKAVYGPEEAGHYALNSDCYCHFTSPIRRYPDLTVHRMLDTLLRGKRPPQEFDRLAQLGEHCSQREQRAEVAERELIKLKLLNFFAQKIGEEMEAVITGVESFGIFAQGLEIPAEGLIHIDSLHDDHYELDDITRTLAGRRANNEFRLGDLIRVEIAHVDTDRRELDLAYLSHLKRKSAPRGSGAGPRTTTRGAQAGGKRATRKGDGKKNTKKGKPKKSGRRKKRSS